LLGRDPRLIKKNLPGHGLTKVEKHYCKGYAVPRRKGGGDTPLVLQEWEPVCSHPAYLVPHRC